MSKQFGPLSGDKNKDWEFIFKRYRKDISRDLDLLQNDPSVLTVDSLREVGVHLQELHKTLVEAENFSPSVASVRIRLLMKSDQAYKQFKSLMAITKQSQKFSPRQEDMRNQIIYDLSLSLQELLKSIEEYLHRY